MAPALIVIDLLPRFQISERINPALDSFLDKSSKPAHLKTRQDQSSFQQQWRSPYEKTNTSTSESTLLEPRCHPFVAGI
jgi:hypothetical protein